MALIVIHKCWPCWTSTGTVHVLSVLVYRSGHHGSHRGWSLSIECALVQLTELSGNFLVKHGCPRVQNSWRTVRCPRARRVHYLSRPTRVLVQGPAVDPL